jgi:MFS family permease
MAEPAAPAAQRASLAAAIASVTVFGAGVSLTAPLLSLTLEARGVDATLIGLNAAAAFLGVIFGPLLTPALVRRAGLRPVVLAGLALDAALVLLLKLFDSLAAWFIIRVALGSVGSTIFTASEAWIGSLAGAAMRGRIIGLYAAALSVGYGVGPLLLAAAGIGGWAPYLANVAICGLAALPLAAARAGSGGFDGAGHRGPLAVFAAAPVIVLTVGLFGLVDTATLSLLPIWARRIGLDPARAAASLAAVYFGSVALQVPIGWLSDRLARSTVLRICAAAGLVGAALVPLAAGLGPGLVLLLVLWGGVMGGLYPVALSMAGDRFRGPELVAANAAVVTSYGLGSLLGPALGGAAMDLWNPHGLLALFVLAFAGILVATKRPRTRDGTAGGGA